MERVEADYDSVRCQALQQELARYCHQGQPRSGRVCVLTQDDGPFGEKRLHNLELAVLRCPNQRGRVIVALHLAADEMYLAGEAAYPASKPHGWRRLPR